MEILERCMYLARWNSKHTYLAENVNWETLVKRSVNLILDREAGPHALERLGFGGDRAPSPLPRTWIHLLVQYIVGEERAPDFLEKALRFHREVSGKAAAHLALVGDNTLRTPWLAAQLLAKNPMGAQDASKALLRHLDKTRPSARSLFEKHFCDSRFLYEQLVEFSRVDPPCLLWKKEGMFEELFKFLAPRFLLCPDHVLDCERIHARWQWTCDQKRNLKLFSLNAMLRTTHLLENNHLPTDWDLHEHLEAEQALLNSQRTHAAEDGVALGWRSHNCAGRR